MARLLCDNDFLRQIQAYNLEQITEGNKQIQLSAEQTAQTEMIGHLVQRYITDEVFTDTTVFSLSVTYKAKNLVYLNAAAYSAADDYVTGELTLQNGIIYSSIAGNTAEAFDLSHWTALGVQFSFFFVTLPFSEYNSKTTYFTGNQIFYKNNTYTCQKACINILPTIAEFWGTGTQYTITSALTTDTSKWTAGDNRNQLVVTYLIDIALHHLYSRINPHNVPDLRKERYNGNGIGYKGSAIGWLKDVASGETNADLPVIDPQQGVSISYGNANGYNSDGSYSISRNTLW